MSTVINEVPFKVQTATKTVIKYTFPKYNSRFLIIEPLH